MTRRIAYRHTFDMMKTQQLNYLLTAIVVALVLGVVMREVQHRAKMDARDAADELWRVQAQAKVDSLTMQNARLIDEAHRAIWTADSIVTSIPVDRYHEARKGIPTASDQALKDVILWKRPRP